MTKTLNEALLAFQGLQVSAKKDGKNPHFRSNYATLESVIHAASQAQQFGICFTQEIDFEVIDGSVVQFVRTVIIHAPSGETRTSRTPILTRDNTDPQKLGSGISYSKRYGLQSALAIPSEDDDGNAATHKPAQVGSSPRDPLAKSPAQVIPPAPVAGATNSSLKEKLASVSDLNGLNSLYGEMKAELEAMSNEQRSNAITQFSDRKAELKG